LEQEKRERGYAEGFWRIWKRFGIIIILLVFGLILSLLSDRFLTVGNLLNITKQVSVLLLISLGLLTVLVAGNVDLTVGTYLGFAGACLALFSIQYGIVIAVLLVLVISIAVGFIKGFLTTRGENLSVIVTLAIMIIFQGATLLITNGRPVIGFPAAIGFIGSGYIGPFPVPVIIAALVSIIIHIMLSETVFGRQLFCIGSNPEAARLSGIPIKKRIITTFIITSILSALAGLVLTARVFSAQPSAGVGEEFTAVGAVLIGGASLNGGAGTVIGTIAGVLILGMISNGLNLLYVNPYYQYIIKGLIILFAILMDQLGRRK
jgi:ribose transport system permease protein